MSENRIKSLELSLEVFCNPFDPCPGVKDRLPWGERTFHDLLSIAEVFYHYLENPNMESQHNESTENMINPSKFPKNPLV